MGYTLNFMDMERDYVYQYYLFGIVGLLLFICPYFFIIVYLIFRVLYNFKNHFNFMTYLKVMSPLLGLAIAYLSGHVFGWVSPMMWLAIIISILNFCVETRKNEVD